MNLKNPSDCKVHTDNVKFDDAIVVIAIIIEVTTTYNDFVEPAIKQ